MKEKAVYAILCRILLAVCLLLMLNSLECLPLIKLDCPGGCDCDETFENLSSENREFKSWPFHQLHTFLNAKFFDVSGNSLTHIPLASLRANFPSLEMINIRDNPFPCHAVLRDGHQHEVSVISSYPKGKGSFAGPSTNQLHRKIVSYADYSFF